MTVWPAIARHIAAATGTPFVAQSQRSVGGGCINATYVIGGLDRHYFVKLNQAAVGEMFAAEADGLRELARSAAVRVPIPICWGVTDESAYLVLEHLELGRSGRDGPVRLGRALAALHGTHQDTYGWHRNNTIGATPQTNERNEDWTMFWREHRLGYQLELAARNGHGGALQRQGEQLLLQLAKLLGDHRPAAALLHGDLWSGNYAYDASGAPVLFDPAVYFGDRETDLAMTELFGGFDPDFYASYEEAYPLDAGYRVRKMLYNLYHVLNHLNLFGGGYRGQAERMIQTLLAEVRG